MNQERTTPARQSFLERHHFLFRRLHSLTGVVPIGLFMLVHLTTNSSIVWGAINAEKGATNLERTVATFQKEVYFIHSLPFLVFTEIFILWLPIAFHSILGVYYARTGHSNTSRYAYQDNWRYTLQRLSGYVGLLFIFYHVATLRWGWTFLVPGGTKWEYTYAASTLAASMRGSMDEMTIAGFAVSLFYFIGVTALVYHFANGLWTAAITWGLTVSARAQKRWGYVCAGLGLGLMLMGWSSVIGFATLSPEQAMRVENKVMPVDIRLKLEQDGKLKPMPGDARSAGIE